ESYVSDTRNRSICGAGGTTIYKLAADTPGEYRFVAQYGRDWEDSPIKSIVLLLTVKPGFRLFR
ncbi:MAG: protease inhibitor I42 family protein, partial [Candidatus Methanomethylophilaceae archaeon]|nr:protease inhibitor I42 family protein [Candidatus Methanomethylophilaceae archaeon]